MIQKLEHSDREIAIEMRLVFQASYAIEAKLLDATDFPPLKRPLEAYFNSQNLFFGCWVGDEIGGIIEIDNSTPAIHIQSLVVQPRFFRQGIAQNLLKYTFNHFKTPLFTVETGLKNEPATKLYKKFGFKEVKQYDTDHGVRKVRFEREFD